MDRFASAICVFVLLLSMRFAASAADHTVMVGGSGLVFTPSTLTIAVGDTVTFKNAGGVHNVVADDGSFHCANGCRDDGGGYGYGGGAGSPNGTSWSFQMTYTSVGTFGYHCEMHGGAGAGMFGSVTVQAATAAPTIGGGFSGNWYNPVQSGSGFQIEVTSNFSQMLAVWFVYTPGGSNQQWVYAQGAYDSTSNTVTLPALLLQNGTFPSPASNYVASDIQKTSWGTLTFTFSDCNSGTVSWSSILPDFGSGSMPITRLTQIAGTSCP